MASSAAGAAYDPAADRWEVLPPAPVAGPGRRQCGVDGPGGPVLGWGRAGTTSSSPTARPTTRRPGGGGCCRRHRSAPGPSHQAVWTGQGDGRVGRLRPVLPGRQRDPRSGGGRLRPGHRPVAADRRRAPPWSGDDGSAVTRGSTAGARWSGARGHLGRLRRRARHLERGRRCRAARPLPSDPACRQRPATRSPSASRPRARSSPGPAGPGSSTVWRGARPDGTWRRTARSTASRAAAGSSPAGPAGSTPPPGSRPGSSSTRIAEDRWAELPLPPVRTRSAAVLIWTGSELLFWGGVGDEGPEMDGAIWHCC